jgi:hypothetical protein
MFWIFANHANYSLALDDFAIIAHLLYRWSNLHWLSPALFCTLANALQRSFLRGLPMSKYDQFRLQSNP